MARVPDLEVKEHPELKDLVDQICGERRHLYPNGLVRGNHLWDLYSVLLHRPPVAAGWLQLISAVRAGSTLAPVDQELVIVLVAIINKSDFEYHSHAPKLLKAGMAQKKIDALPNWRDSMEFSERERAILAYADVMTRSVVVPDEVFEGVRSIYDTAQIVEITALTAAYNFTTRFTVALQLGKH
jgi:alkylhydroperoxidase family enzyme